MYKSLNNKILNTLIKLLIGILLAWVLYRQIFAKDDIDRIWSLFVTNLESQPLGWLIVVVLLMPVNWIFENLKWRVLIQDIESLSFWQSFAAIFAGVTFSVFTPNRVGEYGGRVLFVKAKNNWKVVVATLVGSYSQLLAILSFGVIGFGVFMSWYFDLDVIVLRSVLFLSIAFVAVLLFCFYNLNLLIPLGKKIPYAHKLKRIVKNVNVLKSYSHQKLNKALGYAVLRYLTYTFQYFLILRYFGIEVNLIQGLSGIATIFLFQTSIPLPPLMGLMARGELAIHVWEKFCDNEISILAATFVLWFINIILPAIIGAVFIANTNILKSLGFAKPSKINPD